MKKFFYLLVLLASFTARADSFDDFFRAVRADNASGVQSLLNRGFDPNTRDANGLTGLLIAIREPSPKVIEVLLASPKTDVESRNASDESPLMLAAIKGNIEAVKALIARDADINKPGWTALHYAASGTTPLMMAAMYGSLESVKLLLDEGADPLMKNQQGMTATQFAQRAQRQEAADLLAAAVRSKQPNAGKW